MEGYYDMADESGEMIRVAIGRFYLTQESAAHVAAPAPGDDPTVS
jgi:uncharacterized protein affecting Mg2+/Co2+ transport